MKILFLALDSPWPAYDGASLRSLGLLKELGKRYLVELIVLSREALSAEQTEVLQQHTQSILNIPLRDVSLSEKSLAILVSLARQIPYHSAVLERSFQEFPEIRQKIQQYPGLVFTSIGHWGCLVLNQPANNWILNQCDAEVEFWRVYAAQTTNLLMRLAAMINYSLAKKMYPLIYANVGCIISVCEEDKQLTLSLAPTAHVEVIENGVDCAYLVPDRVDCVRPPRLLFTGTSVARNRISLRRFVEDILPLIRKEIPDVELLVAGRFSERAQAGFQDIPNIKFTGLVPDIRPYFNQSDVFIAPFRETYGSKLKIAEAMSMAMPIVSTLQGIRGFPLVDGQSVRIAHDDDQFARYVIELMEDPALRRGLGLAARELAEYILNWPLLGIRLEKIIEEVHNEIGYYD